jgi:hypothetical protein
MDLQMQMKSDYKLVRVEDYEPLIGAQLSSASAVKRKVCATCTWST